MIASHYLPLRWAQRVACVACCWAAICLPAAAAEDEPTVLPAPAANGMLIVSLSSMKNDEGSLVYAMWSGPEGWLETNTVRDGSVPIVDGQSEIRFENLPFGEYAISVYQDKNENGKLDSGLFGVPKEPFGFSNSPKIRFGPPKYESAAFMLNQREQTIQIPVRKLFE